MGSTSSVSAIYRAGLRISSSSAGRQRSIALTHIASIERSISFSENRAVPQPAASALKISEYALWRDTRFSEEASVSAYAPYFSFSAGCSAGTGTIISSAAPDVRTAAFFSSVFTMRINPRVTRLLKESALKLSADTGSNPSARFFRPFSAASAAISFNACASAPRLLILNSDGVLARFFTPPTSFALYRPSANSSGATARYKESVFPESAIKARLSRPAENATPDQPILERAFSYDKSAVASAA